jgi:glycosyltransferase involved in cell wall biosynthesis
MSTFNAEGTLGAAVASLRSQTFSDWELLIVDDGSTDRSVDVAAQAAAADPRIRVLPDGGHRGLPARLNMLVDASSGPLYGRMDADDIAYPERLERQVEHLDSHPEVDLVGASMLVFGVGGKAIGKRHAPCTHHEICRRPASGFRLFHPTWLGRRDWFRRYRYAADAERCEDQDLLYRSYRHSVFANLPEPLLGYREERLVLKNLLLGRLNMARRTGRGLASEGRWGQAAATASTQAAKGFLDTLAVTTGLDHRLLRQRAGPLSSAEGDEWRSVWAAVHSV